MTDAKESEKLHELERIARGNGSWNHIKPFVEALTRERDEAVDRGLELQAQLMTMLVQRDEARVVTDAMVERAKLALWHYWGGSSVDNDDIRVMLTAALTQGDA